MNTTIQPPEDTVTLGDRNVETSSFDRYKGRRGITDRIALVSSKLLRAYTYFYEGGGQKKIFRAPTNPECLAFVKKTLGEPTQRFGVILFHYMTNDAGELIEPEKLKGKMKTWVWSEARYEELTGLNRQWPLLDNGFDQPQVDILVKCSEEQFQRMQFTPTPSAHWKSKDVWYKALKEKEIKATTRLKMALGRVMSDQEIMALLGGATAPAPGSTDNAGDVDLSDVVDE